MTHQGDVGGSTNSITWLCEGLARHGEDVFLACRPESLIASRFADGPVQCVPARLPRGLRLVAEARRWAGWIQRLGIDVVNAHASLDRHLVSYLRLLGCRAALVHTRRNVVLSSGGRLRARFDAATTDAIIAVSEEVRADLVRRGVPAGHVRRIRNGLPLERLRTPDPADVARVRSELELTLGRPVICVIARRKSQEDLLRAVALLGRPVEVLLAGVEEDAELGSLARSLPPQSRARCLGFRRDVPEILALSDIFVLPSEIEGFSLALLEAMARGLPCIATDAGGNREALAEGAGVLVPPRDPEALAIALARIFDAPEASRELGRRARGRVHSEFDVARTVRETRELYASLIARRQR
jgi:glycosyltransferase involved in cell wall biosynthesis